MKNSIFLNNLQAETCYPDAKTSLKGYKDGFELSENNNIKISGMQYTPLNLMFILERGNSLKPMSRYHLKNPEKYSKVNPNKKERDNKDRNQSK